MSTEPPHQASTKPKTQRLLAPSLFVGPPSRNASNIDLRPPANSVPSSNRVPLLRQRSTRYERPGGTSSIDKHPPTSDDSTTPAAFLSKPPILSHFSGPIPILPPSQRRQQPQPPPHQPTRTDAIWAEMQHTLSEVSLSASARACNVFTPSHAKALDELRVAQIALAQAWARSEADDVADPEGGGLEDQAGDEAGRTGVLAGDDRAGGGRRGGEAEQGGKGMAGRDGLGGKSQLEEETENDILLARKRRLANDRYFERVNKGVVDVVAKLEDVAKRMGGVEMESKEIWGEGDSMESGSSG